MTFWVEVALAAGCLVAVLVARWIIVRELRLYHEVARPGYLIEPAPVIPSVEEVDAMADTWGFLWDDGAAA